jgi:dihydropyrimidinase
MDAVGTDNASWSCAQKRKGLSDFTKIPSGLNGLEDRMSMCWEKGVRSGKFDPKTFVKITSSAAAKIFNLYQKKGRIAVGSDADIVIWNPTAERTVSSKTHHHGTDYNVFEGMKVHGVAELTICKGRVVWENNKFDVEAGFGKFVPVAPFCEHVFGAVRARQQVNLIIPFATNIIFV